MKKTPQQRVKNDVFDPKSKDIISEANPSSKHPLLKSQRATVTKSSAFVQYKNVFYFALGFESVNSRMTTLLPSRNVKY